MKWLKEGNLNKYECGYASDVFPFYEIIVSFDRLLFYKPTSSFLNARHGIQFYDN